MDLSTIVEKCRAYDERQSNKASTSGANKKAVHSIYPPNGFIFIEGLCGSTLVANSLVFMDPESHRIYSESIPPTRALKSCEGKTAEECDVNKSIILFQDAVYLMGRTSNPTEDKLFYKMQSIANRYIDLMRRAFPDTPWIFVYRDPVQVLMSYAKKRKKGWEKCLNSYRHTNSSVQELVKTKGRKIGDLSQKELCAAYLVSSLYS